VYVNFWSPYNIWRRPPQHPGCESNHRICSYAVMWSGFPPSIRMLSGCHATAGAVAVAKEQSHLGAVSKLMGSAAATLGVCNPRALKEVEEIALKKYTKKSRKKDASTKTGTVQLQKVYAFIQRYCFQKAACVHICSCSKRVCCIRCSAAPFITEVVAAVQ
jgi:hypothetical protein